MARIGHNLPKHKAEIQAESKELVQDWDNSLYFDMGYKMGEIVFVVLQKIPEGEADEPEPEFF